MDQNIIKRLLNPFMCRFYFFKSLPGAWFFRLKVTEINSQRSSVSVPYTWATKNPFQSIYFAALTAAAELSTGIIALVVTSGHPVSMLVTGLEGKFVKKARGIILFTCDQVQEVSQAAEEAIRTGEGVTVSVRTTGKDEQGDTVAYFTFQWSLKRKSNRS
jgi:phage terminase large subunit-like protein